MVRRWPIIITGVVDQLHRACHILSIASQQTDSERQTLQDKLDEGKGIIEKIGELKYHMGRDHPLQSVLSNVSQCNPVSKRRALLVRPIPDDSEPLVDEYNAELNNLSELGRGTWFTAPWLFSECVSSLILLSNVFVI